MLDEQRNPISWLGTPNAPQHGRHALTVSYLLQHTTLEGVTRLHSPWGKTVDGADHELS